MTDIPYPGATDKVVDKVWEAVRNVAKVAYGQDNWHAMPLETIDKRIIEVMPAAFCGARYLPVGGIRDSNDKPLPERCAYHGCRIALASSPYVVGTSWYHFAGPSRPSLLYDLAHNRFEVADPWRWRREFAESHDEELPVSLSERLSGQWEGAASMDDEVTDVRNVETGQIVTYTLPPHRAVVAAYYQLGRSNYNWWDYDLSVAKRTKHGYAAGDWWAKDHRRKVGDEKGASRAAPSFLRGWRSQV